VLLAALATPLVVSVHSVVSLDFSIAQLPGWHSTIFPPYFVVGAMYSGFTMVVVLTDGIDTRSRLTSDQVSTIASTIDIPVYIVAVVAMIDDPRQTVAVPQVMTGALPDLAKWTGGEMFVASAPAHASLAARQIVDELRHQYLLAFEASSQREGWRPLEVRARDNALTVRARAGYTSGNGGQAIGNPTVRIGPSTYSLAHSEIFVRRQR